MTIHLKPFADNELTTEYLQWLLDEHALEHASRCETLWNYYRNPLLPPNPTLAGVMNEHSRTYQLAQEVGLPARITGIRRAGSREQMTDLRRKEVVIENDIGWRIRTMIDYLFGRPLCLRSRAESPHLAATIERVLAALFDANGGEAFFQELALYGAVYGFVDIALRIPADWSSVSAGLPARTDDRPLPPPEHTQARPGTSPSDGQDARGDRFPPFSDRAVRCARLLRFETVEAPRVLPVLADDDYRTVRYWIQKYTKRPSRLSTARRGILGLPLGGRDQTPARVEVVEILGPTWWQRYEDRDLVAEGPNTLGQIPVVHIQNVSEPGQYVGAGDVEPLIPLQDELNTRLSDRANRVTYQSFKMYLGKGIDDFLERPVGPGQMWATQNSNASIEEFGTDEGSPSEDIHIEQIRAALDKASGVPPLAAGLVRGNIGELTSATALRVALAGLLARTERKRITYGAGIRQLAELALAWLDHTGVLKTRPEDRRVELHWPSPLPQDDTQQLRNAEAKQRLGVPTERILSELGYERTTHEQ